MTFLDELLRLTRLRYPESRTHPGRWQPPLDVYRTADGWLVKVELAGVRVDEIDVETRGSVLTVRGRRCDTAYVEAVEHYSLEIAYSNFERSVQLPSDLESASIATRYQDGMLLVHIVTASP